MENKIQLKPENVTSSAREKRVLVLDDEDFIRRLFQISIEKIPSFKVEAYADSIAAYERLKSIYSSNAKNYYSLVLADLYMPNMGGIELSEKVNEFLPDLPFLLITGNSTKIDAAKLPKNVKKILDKPLRFDDLIKAVKENSRQ